MDINSQSQSKYFAKCSIDRYMLRAFFILFYFIFKQSKQVTYIILQVM